MKLIKHYFFMYVILFILALVLCFSLNFIVEDFFLRYKLQLKDSALFNSKIEVDSLISEIDTLRLYIDDNSVKEIVFKQLNSSKYFDEGYIWINAITNIEGKDYYGNSFFHPYINRKFKQSLDIPANKNKEDDSYINQLDFVKINGEQYISYNSKNYLTGIEEKKITYAKYYEEFDWIIAFEISEDNIYTAAVAVYNFESRILVFMYFVIIILYFLACFLLYKQQKIVKEKEILTLKNIAINAKTEAKSTFLATVSHELRTPLTAIIGLNDLLRENVSDKNIVLDYSSKINDSSTMLLSIINDVLDMSAIEKGKLKLANTDFSIKKIIHSVSGIYYKLAQKKSIEFEVLLINIYEEELIGDGHRINQILLNLLSNALKFTSEGKIVLKVMEKKVDDHHLELAIEVVDTGCGMSQDMHQRLFEQFEQADANVAKQYGGSGLGLSITKRLVDSMNGSIDVISELDKGSTFIVKIVLEIANKLKEDAYDLKDKKVFIIDSDLKSSNNISRILDSWDVENISFKSANKALAFLRTKKGYYNIYIVADTVDDINNKSLCEKITNLENREIVLLKAGYNVDDLGETGSNSITSFIKKPIFKSDLYTKMVNKVLNNEEFALNSYCINFSGIFVLSVEDNQINQLIISKMLETCGIKTIQLNNGKEAVNFMKYNPDKDKISMIFMDIRMPIMDGLEATKNIRNVNKKIPIIALSANAFEEDKIDCIEAGMNNHISKPIDKNQLLNILQKYLIKEVGD